jgi:antirestriction protein ArdC
MPGPANRTARRKVGEEEPPAPRANLYDEVTARIIGELDVGRLPWVQPWGRVDGIGPGLPRNALTARPYSGVNILILWGAVIEHGWPSQSWLTFRQAQDAGGCVRKGERGQCVVYADRFTPEAEKERASREGGAPKAVPFLKRFTVFNVAQCEGLRAGLASDPAPLPDREIVPVAEEVIAASGVEFRVGGERSFYAPSLDFVQVPPQPAFFDQINYYRTCLHELTHATGHPKRLRASWFGSRNVRALCARPIDRRGGGRSPWRALFDRSASPSQSGRHPGYRRNPCPPARGNAAGWHRHRARPGRTLDPRR